MTTISDIPTVGPTGEVEFDSIDHLVRVARATGLARNPRSAKVVDDKINFTQVSWLNYATFEKVETWLTEPQPHLLEKVDQVKRLIEDVVQAPTRERRKVRRNREDGEELDPQAVLERRADGWSDVHHKSVPKHSVTVAINLSISGAHRPEHLVFRGAAVAALADLLTQGGHSVEVVGFDAGRDVDDRGTDLLVRLPLKRADAPMDMTGLAVAAGEIGFYRLVMLKALGRCTPGVVDGGFGRVRMMRAEEINGVDVLLDANVLTLGQAVATVKQAMKKFGSEERA